MSSARLRRVNREIADCANDTQSDVQVEMVDESPFHLIGTFPGPPNSPYEDGVFKVDIAVPEDQWTPVYTLKSTLMSLRSLLCSPEPNDPQDAEVAKHYMTDQASYEETAREWTRTYAQANTNTAGARGTDAARLAGVSPELAAEYINMGFPEDAVLATLRRLNVRGANVQNISKDEVVNELLRSQS
ncbi:E2 ubiquitin-conjugating enzyme [Malassezia cuniculi]|uniref:E2 ubiquitin-conjugating enzyme n=1 Tax=Malassezia cuniculi TaxID=948313 RepID=A0AAF0J827_9BASI|nr:E2 ubiquitin-conjugating enzyme [Malassezia cuniculi]